MLTGEQKGRTFVVVATRLAGSGVDPIPDHRSFGLAAALRGEWADMDRLTVVVQQPLSGPVAPDMGDLVDIVCPAEDARQTGQVLEGLTAGLLLGSSSENQLLRPH